MPGTFTCPTCNAPLDYDGRGESVHCPFCGNTVIVPLELRGERSAPEVKAWIPDILGIPPDQAVEVKLLLQTGLKADAVRVVAKAAGVSPKDAELAVDALLATDPELKNAPVEIKSHRNYGMLLFGMFLCGIAAIFPIIYIPMGITAWQAGIVPAAIAAFIAAFIWAICWAGVGAFIIYHLF